MRLPSRPAGQGRAPPGISTIPRPVCSQRRAGRPSFQSIPMMQRKTRARYHYPSAESSRRRRSRSAARLTAIAAAAHYSRTPGPSFPCDKCNPSATGIARRHLSASRVGCLFPCVRGSPLSLRPPAAVAVPGPIAGAGLPALAVAGGALWLFRSSAALVSRSRSLEVRVLGLESSPRPATDVARADALRDDTLEVHPARVSEDGCSLAGDRLAQLDASPIALVLRDRSFASLFLRSSNGSKRTSRPSCCMMS